MGLVNISYMKHQLNVARYTSPMDPMGTHYEQHVGMYESKPSTNDSPSTFTSHITAEKGYISLLNHWRESWTTSNLRMNYTTPGSEGYILR